MKTNNSITLYFTSDNEPSAGITNRDTIEIKMPRYYVEPDTSECPKCGAASVRKEIKELFSEAVETLFDGKIVDARFEDECSDCGAQLIENKSSYDVPRPLYKGELKITEKYHFFKTICSNKNCISNTP